MGTYVSGGSFLGRVFLAAVLFLNAGGFASECAKQTNAVHRAKVHKTNRTTRNLVRMGLVVAAALAQTTQAGITTNTAAPAANPLGAPIIVSTPSQPRLGMPPIPDKNLPLIVDPATPQMFNVRAVPCPAGIRPGDCRFSHFAVVDVIDSFQEPAPDAGFGGALPFGQSRTRSDTTPTVMGDERDLEMTGTKAGEARANLLKTKDGRTLLRFFQKAGTVAQFSSTYDGKDAKPAVQPAGLGKYGPGKRGAEWFLVGVDFASHPGRLRIVVYDGADEKNQIYSEAFIDVAPTDRLIEYSVSFSDFKAGPVGGTDFAQMGAIQVSVEPSVGEQKEDAVFDLDYVQVARAVCQPCDNPVSNMFRPIGPAGFGPSVLTSGLGYDGGGYGGYPGFFGGLAFLPLGGGLVDINPMIPQSGPMNPGGMFPPTPSGPGTEPMMPVGGVPEPPSLLLTATGTMIAFLILRFRSRG